MTGPAHIALVGCGFTGTSAFFQLVDSYPVRKITIFEATGDFGPGYAYRTDESSDYLINNTTDTMCLVPSNRRAFVEWLKIRPDIAPDLDERGHLSRPVFGRFLQETFAATRLNAAIKGIEVELVRHEVTEITETSDRVSLSWTEGSTSADAVILTTGRCVEYQPFPAPPTNGASYHDSHIQAAGMDDIPMDATVHVMGASLSAYDVVNRLFSPATGCRFEPDASGGLNFVAGPNRRQVVLCSRSGRLKNMQSQRPARLTRTAFTPENTRALAERGTLTLAALAKLVADDAAANGTPLDTQDLADPYRDCDGSDAVTAIAAARLERGIADAGGHENFLVDFFGDAQLDIWNVFAEHLLPAEQEAIYRHRIETAALCFAAPCPIPTAQKLLALIKAGHLRIVKGTGQVALDPDGTYRIEHAFGTEIADNLINTIGAVNRDVCDPEQDKLTRNLASRGYLRPYTRDGVTLPGADIDMTSFRARSAQNIYVANMMLWGPGFFTSSAFMMATVIERLLAGMFADPTA